MASTSTSLDVKTQLELFEFAPGRKAGWGTLQRLLPDVETALFFGRAYKMNYDRLSTLLFTLFRNSVTDALSEGSHSTTLQDYLVDVVPTDVLAQAKPDWVAAPPPAQFLPQLWDSIDVVVASSIQAVADKIGSVIDALPSKQGVMVFQTMAQLNKKRPTIGVQRHGITHPRQTKNLFILDDSGSMTEPTIRAIIGDVIASAWKVNATLALVSSSCRVFEPQGYDVDSVMRQAEFGGTQYETLKPLLDQNWDVVTTIADYDSSLDAKRVVARATGRIRKLLDLSLVNRPTFLAECVGQLANSVEPILVATDRRVLQA